MPAQLVLELPAPRVEKRHSKLIEWSYLRLANLNTANGKPLSGAVALLEMVGMSKQSAVLTEKLGDLYSAQGKPSSAVYAWSLALKLDPSPQQKIRLFLALGEKLTGMSAKRKLPAWRRDFYRAPPTKRMLLSIRDHCSDRSCSSCIGKWTLTQA